MTRLNPKNVRVYSDGYDLSGYERSLSPVTWGYETSPDAAFSDECKNVVIGQPTIDFKSLDGFLDNDTAGKFAIYSGGSGTRNIMVVSGTANPAVAGDPVFAWTFEQNSYNVTPALDGSFTAASLGLGGASYAGVLTYSKPWGVLLHAKAAETAVNTAVGIDDKGAATTAGGIFFYQLFTSNGTVTLKVQDAATNSDGNFSDLSGATSGSIDATTTPVGGKVALTVSATVRRYLRWQLVFGTATTATFALAFVRG